MSLSHLNIWSLVDSIVWGGLGSVALLEGVYFTGVGFESLRPFPIGSFLCFVLKIKDVSSQHPAPSARPACIFRPAIMDSNALEL